MEQQSYAFCAMLSRMKYISRWGLMRSSRNESLSEHTAEVAVIAHVLSLIARDECGEADVRPDVVAVAALYHDASEILTGDMPTPVKYKNEQLKTAYKAVEEDSAKTLASLLPEKLRPTLQPMLTGEVLTPREAALLKGADIIGALVKCIEEESSGNREFRSAKAQQYEKLLELNCPAVRIFMEQFLPCYEQDLDELTHSY